MAPAPTTRIRMGLSLLFLAVVLAKARTHYPDCILSGKLEPQLVTAQPSVVMGPGFRQDDIRDDGSICPSYENHFPETISSTSRNCSFPKNISLPTKKVGEPNAPRATASSVFLINLPFTSGSPARVNSFCASRPEDAGALAAISGSSIFFGSRHMWWKAASTYVSNPPSSCAAIAARIRFSVLTGKKGFQA